MLWGGFRRERLTTNLEAKMLNLDLKSKSTGGMSLKISSIDDGISIMMFMLKNMKSRAEQFSISVGIGNYDTNGWMLEFNGNGYALMMACNKPLNGFIPRAGFWAYKQGSSSEPSRWHGGGDFAWRPKRLFVSFEAAEKRVAALSGRTNLLRSGTLGKYRRLRIGRSIKTCIGVTL
jgi:hypothetical protein